MGRPRSESSGVTVLPDSELSDSMQSRPPAILMLTERFAPDTGGVARSAARTAEAMSLLGINVHVLAWTRTLQPGELSSTACPAADGGEGLVHRM